MISSAVFLSRLRRIATDSASEQDTSGAVNLFRSYQQHLYSRFDIHPSNRLTRAAKSRVNDLLAELRLELLHVEFSSSEPPAMRAACGAVRHEIEGARRALALWHEVPDGEPDSDQPNGEPADGEPAAETEPGVVVAFPNPALTRCRRRILQSFAALSRSRRLLSRFRRIPIR